MLQNYFIGLYWGPRKEDLNVCVEKVYNTIIYLSQTDDSFKLWYRTAKPKKGTLLAPIDINKLSIEKLFLNAQIYNDIGDLEEDLGYLFSLKSEVNYKISHVLSITCGSYHHRLTNCVNLEILGENIKNKMKIEDIKNIYIRLIEIWQPDESILR
jgi:hypothetical protein